jgi:hypothetical protein
MPVCAPARLGGKSSPCVTSNAQRRAAAAHALRLKEQGWRFLSVRLPPDSITRLDALKNAHGSYRAAIQYLLTLCR